MLNIKLNNNISYCEIPQVNPLRWKTLFRNEDGSFVDQSGWIRCKDFFNDTVAFFREGTTFSIYGYKNDIKANEEGVYFLLKCIKDKEMFLHNLEVINHQLNADLGCVIAAQDYTDDQMVVLIPPPLWETTYRISLITMVIRLSNYGVKYASWLDFWNTQSPSHSVDRAFTPAAIKNVQEYGFKVPEKFAKYWYYAGTNYNSEVAPKQTMGIIHNNGVSDWSRAMAA